MSEEKKLVIGFPKGSLEKATYDLFAKAGYKISVSSRSYYPRIDDKEMKGILIRSQEMSKYVENGNMDCGICGKDWILENNSDVVEICELMYSKQTANPVRWVLCVHEDSPFKCAEDLEGKTIAIIDTLAISTTRFIANKEAWEDKWKREKIEHLAMLLQGALRARNKVGLKMNVPEKSLDEVVAILPSLKEPTIAHLRNSDWLAIEVVVDEQIVREIIPKLKKVGAEGIIEYGLNKVIP